MKNVIVVINKPYDYSLQILLKKIIHVDSKKIIVGLDNIKNLNEINSENIIRRIYQFLFNGYNAPRSKKTRILIKEIKKLNFKYFNIRGMIVKKNDDFLTFSKKFV